MHNTTPTYYFSAEEFYTKTTTIINNLENTNSSIMLIDLDFDNFNYINDLFGYEIGDHILEKAIQFFSSKMKKNEFFSRKYADHFMFCLNETTEEDVILRFKELTQLSDVVHDLLSQHYTLLMSCGITKVEKANIPLSILMDNANYARKKLKENKTNSYCFYNEKMGEELSWQKFVSMSMEDSLKNNEFEMYLQPKVLIKENSVVGSEALVRWNHPGNGMIFPDQFIPIFERNGFIQQIDFFMLQQACIFIKNSLPNGIPVLPISVNFSKVHLNNDELASDIFKIVRAEGISPQFIEIEFTESITSDNFERLVEVVSDLKLLGFKISLDDFGNAYSSLIHLKDLPIDIIKIDKGFLDTTSNSEKGRVIIAKVVELIKSLRMISIVEGVENNSQAEFLKKLSCDFAQGYLYAKPMPAKDFIEFVKSHSTADFLQYIAKQRSDDNKSYLYVIPQEFEMDNWELYTLGKNIDMGLMKGYLDGEATVQYVNDRALEYLGYTRKEFREVFHNSIVAFSHPDDAIIVQRNAEQLIKTGKSLKFQTRAIRKDGKIIILQGSSSCVMDSNGRPIGIYAFQDVTNELEKTQLLQNSLEDKVLELQKTLEMEHQVKEKLRISEERYRLIMDQSDDIMFDWDFQTDSISFSNKFEKVFKKSPITDHVTTNPEVLNLVHPDDRKHFKQWIQNVYDKNRSNDMRFRLVDADGNYLLMRCQSTPICDNQGVPIRAVGVFAKVIE